MATPKCGNCKSIRTSYGICGDCGAVLQSDGRWEPPQVAESVEQFVAGAADVQAQLLRRLHEDVMTIKYAVVFVAVSCAIGAVVGIVAFFAALSSGS